MTPHFFIVLTVLACLMAAVAFLPFSKSKSDCRKKLLIGAALSLIPIIAKMTFSIFPLLEARIMPIDVYAAIQRDFWLPFAVLFFAFASHLVPSRYRNAILIIVVMLVLVVAQQSSWHLGKPDMYDYKGTIVDGVCRQTSYETCGAASMVTLLNSKGISTTEGEMAMLSMTAPRLGLSPQGAAYGLKRKLGQLGRSEHVAIKVPEFRDLTELPKPFLAGIKFSFRTNHMICVLETTKDGLVVGDPISTGRKTWSWKNFRKMWSGIVIVCN
ncbi:MAG: cysteine peptidase family C39 domain-containing protein [Desulfobacterales bacterium]|jgi:predicted double-glycine peptidase